MRIRQTLQLSAAVSLASLVFLAAAIVGIQNRESQYAAASENMNGAVRTISLMRSLPNELTGEWHLRATRQWNIQHANLTRTLDTIPTVNAEAHALNLRLRDENAAITTFFEALSSARPNVHPKETLLLIVAQLDVRTASMASDILTMNDMTAAYFDRQKQWLRFMTVVLIVILAGIIGSLLWILYTRVIVPIVMLGNASAIVSAGQLDQPILVAGSDEVTTLARSFESMRISLQDRMRDLEAARILIKEENEKLTQRVIERTAQLTQANQTLESFNYSVAHDLRAPMRGIDGWSLALQEDYADRLDDEGRRHLQRIRSDAQRMNELIDDMLRLSKVDASAMQIVSVDLSAMAEKIIGRLREQAPHRQVECAIQQQLLTSGDPKLLEITLTNLLDNAWKFTGKNPQPKIEIGMVRDAEQAGDEVFFVRDNGVGFDMQYAQNLFTPFQRMHAEMDFPGTGIGLATVQRIVQRHGGRVWAEAEVGKGATFNFSLGRKTVH